MPKNSIVGGSRRLHRRLHSVGHGDCPTCGKLGNLCRFKGCVLSVSRIRKSPFTSPSRIDVRVSRESTKFPIRCCGSALAEAALYSCLAHRFRGRIDRCDFHTGNSNGDNLLAIDRYNRRVLSQATYRVARGNVATHFFINFPTGNHAVGTARLRGVLFSFLPMYVRGSFFCSDLGTGRLRGCVRLTRSRRFVHRALPTGGLYTFVTSNSVLPERDNVSSHPVGTSIPFASPSDLHVSVGLPRGKGVANVKVPGKVALVMNNKCRNGSALLGTLRLNMCGRVPKSKHRCIVASTATIGLHSRSNHFVGSISVSVFVGSLPGGGSAHYFSALSTDKDASRTTNVMRDVRTKDRLFLLSRSASTAGFVIHSTFVRRIVRHRGRPVAPFLRHTRSLCGGTKVSAVLITKDSKTFFRVTSAVVRVSGCIPGSVATSIGGLYDRCPLPTISIASFRLPRDRHVVDEPTRSSGHLERGDHKGRSSSNTTGPRHLGAEVSKASNFSLNERRVSLHCARRLVSTRRATTLNLLLGCTIRRLTSNEHALPRVIRFL